MESGTPWRDTAWAMSQENKVKHDLKASERAMWALGDYPQVRQGGGLGARPGARRVDDVIQPFPTFSEAFLLALTELESKVPAAA